MKTSGRILCGLACGLSLSVLLSAVAAETGNPYALIASRNVFGLLPPPPPVDPASNEPPPEPPPKITPNGIMNIFGKLQVLFKVATKPPAGQPQKDASYVMTEGERQDEIEVIKIDEAAGVVTFNNHGKTEEIALIAASNTGSPANKPGMPPGVPGGPGGAGLPPGAIPLGAPGLAGLGHNQPGAMAEGFNAGGGANFGAANNSPFNNQAAGGGMAGARNLAVQEEVTPEAQVIIMEAQRAKLLEQNSPAAAIIPFTPLTHLHQQLQNNGGSGPGFP